MNTDILARSSSLADGTPYTPIMFIGGRCYPQLIQSPPLTKAQRKAFRLAYRRGHRGESGRGYRQRIGRHL